MASLIRLMTATVETKPRALGAYAPRERALGDIVDALVRGASRETAPKLVGDEGADLEMRTIVSKLEPDTLEHPFASVQVLVEVARVATRQTIYTRKVESEVRRLIQAPVPLDDPRFSRTALGRATSSCLRSLFTALADTFGNL